MDPSSLATRLRRTAASSFATPLYDRPSPSSRTTVAASIPLRRLQSSARNSDHRREIEDETGEGSSSDEEGSLTDDDEREDREDGGRGANRPGEVLYRSVKKRRSFGKGRAGRRAGKGKQLLSKKTRTLIISAVLVVLIAGGGWVVYKYGEEVYKDVVEDFLLFPEVTTPLDGAKVAADGWNAATQFGGNVLDKIGFRA